MQNRFDHIAEGLFPGRGTVLLAVSGGRDSVCMAELFLHSGLFARGGTRSFEVAHCNFQLRGVESDGDEDFVRNWCRSNGVELHTVRFDTPGYAREHAVSIEMAARELRYGYFARLCVAKGFCGTAVAHNANDNAETLVLNLLRGTGMRGLAAMREVSVIPSESCPGIPLYRPLLSFSRSEIDGYIASRGLRYREDSTNGDNSYRRNLIRNKVFPEFGKINPSFVRTFSENISRFAEAGAIAEDYLSEVSGRVLNGNIVDIKALLEQKHWKYILFRILEGYGFNSSVADSIGEMVGSGATFSGKTFVSDKFRIVTARDKLIFLQLLQEEDVTGLNLSKKLTSLLVGAGTSVTVEGPGFYEFAGRRFLVEEIRVTPDFGWKVPEGVILADAEVLRFPFLLRRWKAGDWLKPLGLGGRKKLSDIFTDLHKDLIYKESAVVAIVPGMNAIRKDSEPEAPMRVGALLCLRIDDSLKITPSTSSVIRITELK